MSLPAYTPQTESPALAEREPAGAVSLRFSSVSMTFPDGTHALDDVSFEVRRGDFVTIVGPSGCGKSTVLRIAAGLLPRTSGTVELADQNIGFVFQDPTLLPWRSVRKNVELFGELHGL